MTERRKSDIPPTEAHLNTVSGKVEYSSEAALFSTITTQNQSADDGKVQLQRRMGLIGGAAMIVGTMIGSGIFISPKDVLERSGSVGTSFMIWLACGLLSIAGALCYIELGCVVPKSGGEYAYLLEGFGPLHRFFGPIPAFLYSYSRVLVTGPSVFAVVALSFGTYATEPFYRGHVSSMENDLLNQTSGPFSTPEPLPLVANTPPSWLPKLVAAGCVVLVTLINCLSVKLATKTQTFFTAVKVLALAVIIVAGIVKLGQGHTKELARGFTPFGKAVSVGDLATAFYSGLWSYDGWNQLNLSVEELKKPYKTLPRAIWIALPLVMALYILANVAYLTVMTTEEILVEPAVAVEFGNRVLGVMAWVMPVSVACSTFGAANGAAFGNARVAFVAAREGHLVDFLSFVSVRWLTPMPAALSQGSIALIMIAVGNISSLIDVFSFTAWTFYGLTFTCLLILRRTRRNVIRSYTVPLIFPIFMLLAAIALVILPIVQRPQLEYLYAGLFILSGLLFYVPLVYYHKTPGCMGGFTLLVQRILGVAPSKLDSDLDIGHLDMSEPTKTHL